MAQAALILLIMVYLALSSNRLIARLQAISGRRTYGTLVLALLLVPYLLAALPTAGADLAVFAEGLGRMLAYVFLPGLLLLFRPRGRAPLDLFDVLAILAVWFPVELNLLPNLSTQLLPGVSLPLPMLTAICLGFVLFLVIRPVPRLGYSFRLGLADLGSALLALLGFMVIGIPLGLWMGFIQPGAEPFALGDWVLQFVAIYLLTALPEELLFRGLIQNLIEQRFGRTWVTWLAAAAVFGLSHINNTTSFHAPPNWPYVIMATFAGLAYAWAWRRSGKITASALTHTLVNFVWAVAFAG